MQLEGQNVRIQMFRSCDGDSLPAPPIEDLVTLLHRLQAAHHEPVALYAHWLHTPREGDGEATRAGQTDPIRKRTVQGIFGLLVNKVQGCPGQPSGR